MSISMSNKATKITKSDLQFFPSERLTDNNDGGGMPLGASIKGVANEIFNPISSISRTNGSFHARLIYAGVQRADDEPLHGAFCAITKPALDSTVSYLLFKAHKFGELRSQALKRIEAYSVGTIESRMTLLSTQSANSKIIQAYQRQGEPLPLVGDVYCLRQDKKGYEQIEQYVQVVAVKAEDRTFTNPQNNKDFVRTVVQLEISQKLEHDFIGAEYPSEYYIDNPCKIRETHVADAGEYYGVKPLVSPIAAQSAQIQVDGLMQKLVPTNQIETALIDLSASGTRQTLFNASRKDDHGIVELAINQSLSSDRIYQFYAGNAITPTSIYLHTGSGAIVDDGQGNLKLGEQTIGSVDYASGQLLVNNFNGYVNYLKFRPASSDIQVADTAKIYISIHNRSYNYVLTLNPIPTQGTLIVSYRSQGQWYDLRDNGNGVLVGTSQAHGSGTINYTSGTITISCGELPDVDSAILLSWGTSVTYFNRADQQPTAQVIFQLEHDINPSSLNIQNHTVTVNASGKITGDLTGQYDSTNRQIRLNNLNINTLDVQYGHGEKIYQKHNAPLRNPQGKVSIDLGDKAIQPNSVRLRWNLLIEDYQHITAGEIYAKFVDPYKTVRDDGQGKLVDEQGVEIGTVDYAQARIEFNPDTTVAIPKAKYTKTKIGEKILAITGKDIISGRDIAQVQDIYRVMFAGYEYIPAGASMPIDESALVEVWFYDDNPQNSYSGQLKGVLEIDVLPKHQEDIASNSLNISLNGQRCFERSGQLYQQSNAISSTAIGTVNYQTGKITIPTWQQFNLSNSTQIQLHALATVINLNPVDSVTFRTPTAPIRPASLQIRATASDGTAISATANLKGEIKANNIVGYVDVEIGVVDVKFGEYVTAQGNESQDWYNPEAVIDGKIFKPKHVLAHTITYNTVAYSNLPVDSSIVKIDTVRLPQDGRVPIFRRGDTILIGNRQTENIGSAFQSGQTVQLSRQNLDRICVMDSDDKPVLANLWDYDLDAGTITWTTPLDLSQYKMPLKVMHAQEERNRILKADIDGTLSLIFPTKHDYPLENTYVSSVLVGGDLQVRHSIPFTQRNWSNKWQDVPDGDQLLNRLNLRDYPMVLTDDGAITERWLIKWTSSSQFELYGETLGFVLKTDTLQDLAPMNPSTQKPYFTIPRQAFGNDAPWASQDVIRFDTWGTLLPVWVLCAVQPSTNKQDGEDGFTMCIFGDTTEV